MKFRLAIIATLVVFDLTVALLTSVDLLRPVLAAALLLTNPLALLIDHQLRARRASLPARR